MVAFLPQWQIVRTSRISSAQASKAADPGNKIALEINAQAVAHHRHAQIIHRARQLPDLCFGQKLRLRR